ncbi:MAG: ADP-ribosylglycohydrolase family protein [Mycobacteriales bacterium]
MNRTLLPDLVTLRELVRACVEGKVEQGHDLTGLRLSSVPDSYDALLAFAEQLAAAPLRRDWPYDEPLDLSYLPELPAVAAGDVSARVETAFLARVAGCMLGKPFEFDPTLSELRSVLEPAGEWPLRDYVTEATHALVREPQPQWPELVRERITHVCEDDDLNYTVLAMLLLERHGDDFTADEVRRLWLLQLPVLATFGPERVQLLAAGVASFLPGTQGNWADVLNPYDEHCGALIRADAYGYACPGDPRRAARLAFRDASVTHRRTGVYATMFIAAAIANALVADPSDRLGPFEAALSVVPPLSRFFQIAGDSLLRVQAAGDWLEGYESIHGKYAQYSHCRVYQEIGTLFNTARFATDVGHGIGLQVCQGNDTDSFGATAGSYLGALLGPAGFDRAHWLGRFGDTIHLALATFHEQSLSRLAQRMARLSAVPAVPSIHPSE